MVHGRSTFHNGASVPLPRLSRCGQNFGGADLAWGSQGSDAKRLQVAGHAGPYEVVAPGVEADDRSVNAPVRSNLRKVGVGTERIRATYRVVRM
jgi:hypothetical protein